MATTTRKISQEVLSEKDGTKDVVRVQISYRKDARVRGYYLSVDRVTVEERNGYSMVGFALFGGIPSRLMEATARFSAARLASLTPDPAEVDQMRSDLLAKA